MNLLHKRPLATAGITFFAGSLCAFLLPSSIKTVFLALFLLSAILTAVFLRKYRRFLLLLLPLFLAFSLSFAALEGRNAVARVYSGSDRNFRGTVISTDNHSTYSTLTVRINEIDGKKPILPRFITECSVEDNGIIKVGDGIVFSAILSPLSYTAFSDDVTAFAEGVICEAESVSVAEVFSEQNRFLAVLAHFRAFLSERIRDAVKDSAGDLLQELLLGKSALSSVYRYSFRRAGLSHMLAVSGLHISVLAFFLMTGLRKFCVPRVIRTVIMTIFLLLYIAVTGFRLSVIRAGIMAILSYLGFLTAKPYDALTGLSVAASGILLVSPYTIGSTALLLSVAATFGIITVSEATAKWERSHTGNKKKKKTRFRALLSAVIVTFSACLATLPFSALIFGETSLLSIPANLILSLPVSLLLFLAFLTLLCPIPLFSYPTRLLANGILKASSLFSAVPNAVLSLSHPFLKTVCVISALLFFLLLCLPLRRKKTLFLPLCLLLLIPAFFGYSALRPKPEGTVTYYALSGDALLLTAQNDRLYADVSAEYSTLALSVTDMKENGITHLSGLMLTTCDTSAERTLDRFLSSIRPEKVYLPRPTNATETASFLRMEELCEEQFITFIPYIPAETQTVGALSVTPYFGVLPNGKTVPMLDLTVAGENLLYFTSDFHFGGDADLAAEKIAESPILLIGNAIGETPTSLPYIRISDDLRAVFVGDLYLESWHTEDVWKLKNAETVTVSALERIFITVTR